MQGWILVQIVFDAVLSALLLFLILRERRLRPPEAEKRVNPGEVGELIETLRELVGRSESAAEHLQRTLEEQQARVRSLLARVESKEEAWARPTAARANAPTSPPAERPDAEPAAEDERKAQWDEITRLFDEGLSRDEIMKRLRVSRGVVDLVLGLRRR